VNINPVAYFDSDELRDAREWFHGLDQEDRELDREREEWARLHGGDFGESRLDGRDL
jgi:hypothetical protein